LTIIHVCVTCREAVAGVDAPGERPGARLWRALSEAAAPRRAPGAIRPVRFLTVWKRPCPIGVSGPGKRAQVYGDLPPDEARADAGAKPSSPDARRPAQPPAGLPPGTHPAMATRSPGAANTPPMPEGKAIAAPEAPRSDTTTPSDTALPEAAE